MRPHKTGKAQILCRQIARKMFFFADLLCSFQTQFSPLQPFHLPAGSPAIARSLQARTMDLEALERGLAIEFSSFHSSCQLDQKENLLFTHFPSKQISCILCYRVTEIVHVLSVCWLPKKEFQNSNNIFRCIYC